MKRIIFSILCIGILSGVLFYILKTLELNNITNKSFTKTLSTTPTSTPSRPIETSVFIPYWSITSTEPVYVLPSIPTLPSVADKQIYFGVQPGAKGLDTTDAGYKNIPETATILTLRMLDSDQNLDILDNKSRQQTLIQETVDLAKEHNMSDILLDFELSAIPFTSLQNQISEFVHVFSTIARQNNIRPSMALYGDHFYRVRPFDLPVIKDDIDMFYVMSYDLHKAKGNPGPNFPLEGKDTYGTDMKSSVSKFLEVLPPEKITIVFGMYGYDWIVDEQKRPTKTARALPLTDIKKDFIDECTWKNCVVKRDDISAETEVNYIDESLNYHILWFEDETSVGKKIDYLKSVGITNYSFWVWGYY